MAVLREVRLAAARVCGVRQPPSLEHDAAHTHSPPPNDRLKSGSPKALGLLLFTTRTAKREQQMLFHGNHSIYMKYDPIRR